MDLKRLFIFSLVAIAVLALIEPAYALLWPPVIGTCGLGGLFGPLGPFGLCWGGFEYRYRLIDKPFLRSLFNYTVIFPQTILRGKSIPQQPDVNTQTTPEKRRIRRPSWKSKKKSVFKKGFMLMGVRSHIIFVNRPSSNAYRPLSF
jgi:hypothetical protein